jgi:hypothetical protein
LTELTARRWATATLLVKNVPVVDVRAASGAAVARQPQAVPGRVAGDEESQSSSTANLQILTVGVPPTVTREILTLVAEETVGLHLWVSLSPLDREGQVTEIAGISREEDASMTPGHLPRLTLERSDQGVRLLWNGTGDDRVERYLVYRGIGSDWREIGVVSAEGDHTGSYTFLDDEPLPDREVAYGLKAVDAYGAHSAIVKETLQSVPTPTVPTVTPMAAAPTAEPISTAVITGTDGAPLRVRDAPGGEVIGTLEEGTLVIPLKGPITAGETRWQMVETETLTRTATITETTMITGWVASDYVYVE